MALDVIKQSEVFLAGEAYLEKNRPPEILRKDLDLGYRIEGNSVFVYEIRPDWLKPEIIRHHDVAKTTYVQSKNKRKIFWLRGNLKWYAYPPKPTVAHISDFFAEVGQDPGHFFFG